METHNSIRRWATGMAWIAVLACAIGLRAEPVISEFMAANRTALADDDGAFSDWVELHNPDATPVDLAGWYLTDSAANKTKWQFPAVSIPAHGYLVVFASNKDRRDPGQTLHTNFALSADGEYLGLIKPDGATVASEFAPTFPAQTDDVSYGRLGGPGAAQFGFLRAPTPGAANGGAEPQPVAGRVTFSERSGPFSAPIALELSGAGANQRIRYIFAPPSPAGADLPDPTAESPEYSGPLTVNASVVVRAAVFSADDSAHGVVTSAQFVKLDASLATFFSSLPVLVLENHGLGPLEKDGIDHASWLYAYEPVDGTTVITDSPSLTTPMTMTVRGNFTSLLPKKGYNLTLTAPAGEHNAQPLLGLDSAEDWALVAPWGLDRSYIRNAFVYSLSNQIGRWAPRTRFVEMFVDDNGDGLAASDYMGIGVLTDRLKVGRDRINLAPLAPTDVTEPAITGGYVVKLDVVPDSTHYNFVTEHGVPTAENTAVVIDTPKASKLTPAQRDYIHGYIQRMENALVADEASGFTTRTYLDYLDLPSWVDHHVLELFVGNVDGLYRSDYFTKDRGGKLVSGPAWDFDTTMGSGDARNEKWDTWLTTGGIDPWNYGWWGWLTRDPEFRQGWVDRWQELRHDEFSAENLTKLADTLAAQISPEAAARDAARWPDNQGRFPGGFLGEVAHLKDWITQRAIWIDQQFVAAPKLGSSGGTLTFTPPEGAVLIYTLDGGDPRALGGDVAPTALTSATALTVPASANVHVRSYNESMKDVFPGSPWSSVVGGDQSSPLFPTARLVNLSSRAVVGAGDDALIVGVVVADAERKRYLTRAVGPGLTAFGAAGALADPQLSIFAANGVELFRNNGWGTGPDAAKLPAWSKSVGAFALAAGSADSALANEISAGAYTVQVTTPGGQPGVALAELYELDGNGRTVNLSTRAHVRTGEGVLIGGFVLTGPAYQRVLIRGIGPTLGAFGVPGALADPVLTLFSGTKVVATNDRWEDGVNAVAVEATTTRVGAFALGHGSEDAALLVTLPPGAYTVEVRGKADSEGVALLEIYAVP